ncbi:hypothetical protein [Paenibacillus etheri]|uniref:Uncharacterized protein n=1 Tax=Paenibacillus etheri TaxID=1306852 RepID=A0A0W1B0W0_9BACL|nr:hypothetical protein UQ64_10340 [Paenibacillus etheri]
MPSFEYLLELIPRPGDAKYGSGSWSRTYFEFVTGVNSEITPATSAGSPEEISVTILTGTNNSPFGINHFEFD